MALPPDTLEGPGALAFAGIESPKLPVVRDVTADDGGHYPRCLERVGDAPPQYADYEDVGEVA